MVHRTTSKVSVEQGSSYHKQSLSGTRPIVPQAKSQRNKAYRTTSKVSAEQGLSYHKQSLSRTRPIVPQAKSQRNKAYRTTSKVSAEQGSSYHKQSLSGTRFIVPQVKSQRNKVLRSTIHRTTRKSLTLGHGTHLFIFEEKLNELGRQKLNRQLAEHGKLQVHGTKSESPNHCGMTHITSCWKRNELRKLA